jgi:hybrid cluster-associated redox disulfide protein
MDNDLRVISARWTVKEVLDRCPQALPTFLQLQLLCVGCPTEAFHTLADVAREHNLDIDDLVNRIQAVITERP